VIEEIQELQRLLDKKSQELDHLNKQIESKDIEIDEIKSNFNHEYGRINVKKRHYQESLNDYNTQEEQHKKMLKDFEDGEVRIQDRVNSFKINIQGLENDVNKFTQETQRIKNDLKTREVLLKNENEIHSKIHLFSIQDEKLIQQENRNLSEIQNLEVANKRLESEIVAANLRIPTLEEEKKSFVSVKNFKEAGRVSNELKQLNENKTKCQEKIDENKLKIASLKIENESLKSEKHKLSNDRAGYEVELSLLRYEYLLSYLEQLKQVQTGKNLNEEQYAIEDEINYVKKEMSELEKNDYILEKFPKKNEEVEEILERNIENNEEKEEKENVEEHENKEEVKEEDNIDIDIEEPKIEEVDNEHTTSVILKKVILERNKRR
jgi:hypothetical protein